MTLAPQLVLRQSQSLVMTPQLQQAIKLLTLSNLEIEAFIADEVAANPLLEIGASAESAGGGDAPGDQAGADSGEAADLRRTSLESSPVDQLIGEGRAAEDRPLDCDALVAMDDRPGVDEDGRAARIGDHAPTGGEAPDIDGAGVAGLSLADHLHAQLGAGAGLGRAAAEVVWLARHVIDQLDEAGYLTVPLEAIAAQTDAPLAMVQAALALVQSLEPTGVGARSLAECIALQAQEADRYDPAMARLIANLELVARGDFARLRRLCEVDAEDLADMIAELRGYDPKPGLRCGGEPPLAVTPDILIAPLAAAHGAPQGWQIALNPASLPQVIVNRAYYTALRHGCADPAARGWLNERLADANWLVKALDQRARTILKVAEEVVRRQEGFFVHGVAALKPLTLRAVAEAVGLHESTVSRVVAAKFLHCPRGTFALKFLFSSGVAAEGGEGASAEAVKAAIRRLIETEAPDAILSDDALVEALRAMGFALARRTVAKYREACRLGSSVQRRRQKAMGRVVPVKLSPPQPVG